MNKYLRVVAGLSCLAVLILGAVALDPDGPLLSAFHGCAAKRATLLEEIGRKEQLDQTKDAVHRRREVKRQVAAEVLAGRCSLAIRVLPVKIRMEAIATVGSVAIQEARKYMNPMSRTAATRLTIWLRPPVAELSSVRDWLLPTAKLRNNPAARFAVPSAT